MSAVTSVVNGGVIRAGLHASPFLAGQIYQGRQLLEQGNVDFNLFVQAVRRGEVFDIGFLPSDTGGGREFYDRVHVADPSISVPIRCHWCDNEGRIRYDWPLENQGSAPLETVEIFRYEQPTAFIDLKTEPDLTHAA